MLSYHPALDPSHAAFRLLRLFHIAPEIEISQERLQIADFYLLFPSQIPTIRLPRDATSWRKIFMEYNNPYWMHGDQLLVFRRMQPIQNAGIALLQTVGLLSTTATRGFSLPLASVPDELQARMLELNTHEHQVTRFMKEVIFELPLAGPDGLKARTRLLEFRYDNPT